MADRSALIHIIGHCFLYIKRPQNENFHSDHMVSMFMPHFDLTQFAPTPTTAVGRSLTYSGYFRAAYAHLLARSKPDPQVVIDYFRETLDLGDIEGGK